MLTIENDFLKIAVQKTGAELCSIQSKKTGTEYMWDADTEVWGSHAPVLFPIIGALKNGETTIHGEQYKIPKHGFIRHNKNLNCGLRKDNEIVFQLTDSPETWKIYPFHFTFEVAFELIDNRILVKHIVANNGANEMHFSLGGHPAFSISRQNNEKPEDCFLEFETEETDDTWALTGQGFTTGETIACLHKSKTLELTPQLFENDALIFKNLKSKSIALKSKALKEVVKVTFNDFKYLGLWAKPNSKFVCIEPWNGITDDINDTGVLKEKEQIMTLLPGDTYKATFEIEIQE
jgi:galactose mutarotase-like enzyme